MGKSRISKSTTPHCVRGISQVLSGLRDSPKSRALNFNVRHLKDNVTTLVPMARGEFLAYVAEAVPAYAADKVASGQWAKDEALELSHKSFEELLPHGVATPNNYFFTIRDSTEQVGVGMVWIATRDRGGSRVAYVYDVLVRPEHQRKGHATRALLALEDQVRSLGLSGIALHVFGHNAGAHALYVKLGYQPTNINMFKSTERSGA
jgi:ribosomal protein S18 acetylase RimI-like enzyme